MAVSTSLRRASFAFEQVLARVTGDHWTNSTPCTDWNVRQLVGHVAASSAMAIELLHGGRRNDAIAVLGAEHLGTDPLAACQRIFREQAAAFDALDSLDRWCAHPAGDMSAGQILRFRISDLVLHTWDLADAIGIEPTIDPDLVDEAWAGLQPMASFIGRIGVFGDGASGSMPADAPMLDRLLDLTGRRPHAMH